MRGAWPLPGERIVGILMQTLSALPSRTRWGSCTATLKPENIMVLAGTDDEGRPADVVKVCDFGIAKITNDRSASTCRPREGAAHDERDAGGHARVHVARAPS